MMQIAKISCTSCNNVIICQFKSLGFRSNFSIQEINEGQVVKYKIVLKQVSSFKTPLLKMAGEYVTQYMQKHFPDDISYHNLSHISEVVHAAEEIGKAIGLNDEELEIVLIAAWFHDIGYYKGQEGHEKRSVEIAGKFLSKNKYPKKKIDLVSSCIMATKVPQNPVNNLDEILCDADLYHLGSSKFIEKSRELWDETKAKDNDLEYYEWLKSSRDFLNAHHYHTTYARKLLGPKKDENLRRLEERIVRMEREK